MDDDEKRTGPRAHEVGMVLDSLSVEELQERIAVLKGEIVRLEEAIEAKTQSRTAADAVFKL